MGGTGGFEIRFRQSRRKERLGVSLWSQSSSCSEFIIDNQGSGIDESQRCEIMHHRVTNRKAHGSTCLQGGFEARMGEVGDWLLWIAGCMAYVS